MHLKIILTNIFNFTHLLSFCICRNLITTEIISTKNKICLMNNKIFKK